MKTILFCVLSLLTVLSSAAPMKAESKEKQLDRIVRDLKNPQLEASFARFMMANQIRFPENYEGDGKNPVDAAAMKNFYNFIRANSQTSQDRQEIDHLLAKYSNENRKGAFIEIKKFDPEIEKLAKEWMQVGQKPQGTLKSLEMYEFMQMTDMRVPKLSKNALRELQKQFPRRAAHGAD